MQVDLCDFKANMKTRESLKSNYWAPYYHYANASLVIPGIQSSRVSDSGTGDRERTGAKKIWEILLVLFPPFNSAILEPNFDLFVLKKEIVVRLSAWRPVRPI